MELIKKNFLTEQKKAYYEDQLSVEEDVVLQQDKDGIQEVVAGKANVKITEQKMDAGKLFLKGVLNYEILYEGEVFESIQLFKGEQSFEEDVYIDHLDTQDDVNVKWYLEDFTPQLINSRKLNLKALITIQVLAEEMADAKVAIGVNGEDEHIESMTRKFEAVQLKAHKKDVLRLKQDIAISAGNPNIINILWEDVHFRGIDWKATDGKVLIHGELSLFILYQSQTQDAEQATFETAIPVSGNLDVTGCEDRNLLDLEMSYMESHLEIKEDFDGEKRIIGIDAAIHFNLRCFEENQIEIVSDLYGITKDIKCHFEKIFYKKLLYTGQTKKKLSEQITLEKRVFSAEPQIQYSGAEITIENMQMQNEELNLTGFLWVKLFLYHGNDKKYKVQESQIPVKMQIPLNGMESRNMKQWDKLSYHIAADVEQLLVNLSDADTAEVRALVNLHMIILEECEEEVLTSFEMEALNTKALTELPGMVVYFAKEGESLWQVGKKYYMPVSQIKEQNHIVGDVLHQGDKLFLMKTL